MAIGFSERFDFGPVKGWELYQVTIDKYHVMFFFEGGHALLNVADRFSFSSADGSVRYSYEIYGERKCLNVDSILRLRVAEIEIVSKDRLDLIFENGDVLSVFDNPEFRSWWFLGGAKNLPGGGTSPYSFEIGDLEVDELTEPSGKSGGTGPDASDVAFRCRLRQLRQRMAITAEAVGSGQGDSGTPDWVRHAPVLP